MITSRSAPGYFEEVSVATQTSQAINAVSVPASNSVLQTGYTSCVGYDQLSLTFLIDASVTSYVVLWWSNDGINYHGEEQVLANGTGTGRAARTAVKGDYVRVKAGHTDTSAHTISVWLRLSN